MSSDEVDGVWQLLVGHTEVGRNRCNFNRMSIESEHATNFRPEVVLDVIQGYWKLPAIVPTEFPHDYPPAAPLLDRPQPQTTVNALRSAFTHNTVTYASAKTESNLILETFGDRVMGFLLSRLFLDDLKKNGESSAYSCLDHGGFDVCYPFIVLHFHVEF
jgi:dsRNA-specific ribonuclease